MSVRHLLSVALVPWCAAAIAVTSCGTSSAHAPAGSDASTDGGQAQDGAADGPLIDGGGPALETLSVTGPGSITLVPAFAPGIFDYYVSCAAGVNSLAVQMTAGPGALASLVQPNATTPAATQSITVTVSENQAIVAQATSGGMTTQYWVRCLPSDFPPMKWQPHPSAGTRTPGYYLVGSLTFTIPAYAMILDTNGVPVWYLKMPTGYGASTVDSLAKGTVSYEPFYLLTPQPFSSRTLSPLATTVLSPQGYTTDEHELRLLSNGDYLILSYPFKGGVDLTGLGLPLPDGGSQPLGPSSIIQDCTVVELTTAGKVVWTWSASDHFNPVQDTTAAMSGYGPPPPDGGTAYDVFHCDSVDVEPTTGDLLVSAREMDSVFYVQRSTGKVLWKMGGPKASKDDATYVTVDSPFHQQHDARLVGWAPGCNGGTGQVSVFDDESDQAGPSRGALYDVVVGGGGTTGCASASIDAGATAPGTATLSWFYAGTGFPSAASGDFRMLADGSRIIGWGVGGPEGVFSEVDVDKNDLLDFAMPDNLSYRAIKVPLTQFDLSVLRTTSGMP